MKVPLCHVDEIPDEGAKPVAFFGREVLALKVGGRPKANMNACLRLGGLLERQGAKLVCQWHHAEYSCSDVRHLGGPGWPDTRLLVLPTVIEDGVLTYAYGE